MEGLETKTKTPVLNEAVAQMDSSLQALLETADQASYSYNEITKQSLSEAAEAEINAFEGVATIMVLSGEDDKSDWIHQIGTVMVGNKERRIKHFQRLATAADFTEYDPEADYPNLCANLSLSYGWSETSLEFVERVVTHYGKRLSSELNELHQALLKHSLPTSHELVKSPDKQKSLEISKASVAFAALGLITGCLVKRYAT